MKRRNWRVTLATIPKHIPYTMHTVFPGKSQIPCDWLVQGETLEGVVGVGVWAEGSLRSSTPGSGLNDCEILGKVLKSLSFIFLICKGGGG